MAGNIANEPYSTVNLDDSEWIAVRKTLINTLGFTETSLGQAEIIWSDCQWEDNKEDPEIMNGVGCGQAINYFPNMVEVFRKDTLTMYELLSFYNFM